MSKIPMSSEVATLLFSDKSKEWADVKARAQTYAARLRIEAISDTAPMNALSAQQQQRGSNSGQGGRGGRQHGNRSGAWPRGGWGTRSPRESQKRLSPGNSNGHHENLSDEATEDEGAWPQCQRGARHHMVGKCKAHPAIVCFNCDKKGHVAKVCPHPVGYGNMTPVQQNYASASVALPFHQYRPTVRLSTRGSESESSGSKSSPHSRASSSASSPSQSSSKGRGDPAARRESWGEGREGDWLVRARRGKVRPAGPNF